MYYSLQFFMQQSRPQQSPLRHSMRTSASNLILAVVAVAMSVTALATQSPGKNAWDELNPASEAYKVMKHRCQQDAGEVIFATREGVKGVFLESDDDALSYITASTISYGITFKHPLYMYGGLGLYYVEYEADLSAIRRFGKPKEFDGYQYRRVDTRSFNTEPKKERTTSIRVTYKRTTSELEEKVGVHGRLIEVIDDSTKTLLAQRRDYIWLNPSGRGPHGGFICPTIQDGERLPTTFLNRVINANTYSCTKQAAEARRAMPKKWDHKEHGRISDADFACSKEYYKQ